MSSNPYDSPTIEELAPNWRSLLRPAVMSVGVVQQDVDDVLSKFLVYTIERDLLSRPVSNITTYLCGCARLFAKHELYTKSRHSELWLDDPGIPEQGAPDRDLESFGSLDGFQGFIGWLDGAPARQSHATLLRLWIGEVYSRDRVNRCRMAHQMGWTPYRVDKEMQQLAEAARHWGLHS